MQKRHVYLLTSLALISFILTGCAKKEESKVEPDQRKIVVTETTKKATTPEAKKEGGVMPAERPAPSDKPITEERVLFDFERDLEGWEIPDWALEKEDHVGRSVEISQDVASEGDSSLKMNADFPGRRWTAALAEHEQYLDFSPYREVTVDVYIPQGTPLGLRGKIILTVGEGWKFTEMARTIPLIPGKWVTIRAKIEPGSHDWRRVIPDEAFRADVRKIVVRIESNRRPVYKGPVYIDNIRIGK